MTSAQVTQAINEHLLKRGWEVIGDAAWHAESKEWRCLVNTGAMLLMAFKVSVHGSDSMTASKASEPTPRVDELIATLDQNHETAIPFVWRQMVNLARTLERALQKAEARAAELTERKRPWAPEHTQSVIDGQVKEIDRLTALVKVGRERAAEAERDLEQGFMQGAYARLKNLQEAELSRIYWKSRAEAAELDAGRLREELAKKAAFIEAAFEAHSNLDLDIAALRRSAP